MRHAIALVLVLASALVMCAGAAHAGPSNKIWQQDVKHALDQIEEQCKHLLKSKKINWNKVRSRFLKEVKKVRSDADQYILLCRMIAALRDGHAYVQAPQEVRAAAKWPFDLQSGPGLFLCRAGKGIYVKSAWSKAAGAGVKPGMQVMTIDKEPAAKWLAARVETLGDLLSFSTDHQAFFYACHRGLGGAEGSTLRLELQTAKRKKKTVTLTRGRASTVPSGPAFLPQGAEPVDRHHYAKLPSGYGYIHLRKTKRAILSQVDTMLAALGNVPGLILDFRANSGGSFDHDALLGRFVPAGKSMSRSGASPIDSAGSQPYGGPIVVIVDAGACSAAETGSGMFKEDGRAYMIGETPTAGMSSSKTTIKLPSGRFSLYVSVYSNKLRFQGGKGIEGLGIRPHEIVEYDPRDLAAGKDTLIARAEALLAKFPQNNVPYRPERHGWSAD